MLKYIEITNKNIEYATKIQMEIFPNECGYQYFKDVIDRNLEYQKNYLVYDNNIVIGVTGLYSSEDISITNSIWLGWFGVLEEFRRKGKGREILLDTIKKANDFSQKYPIKFFRLYTSEIDNPTALILYDKVMDLKEYYNNSKDFNYNNTCIIYSKSLKGDKVKKWDNQFLNIKGFIKDEKKQF